MVQLIQLHARGNQAALCQGNAKLTFRVDGFAIADDLEVSGAVARDILEKRADYGLLVCGSGIGISIAANRFRGIRAALVTNPDYARLSRQHNNANVIVFGGRFTAFEDAKNWLEIFLSTGFEGGRHERRIAKLDE